MNQVDNTTRGPDRPGAAVGRPRRRWALALFWLAIVARISPVLAALGVVWSALAGGPVGAELAGGLRGSPNLSATMHLVAMAVLTADGFVGLAMLARQIRSGRLLARELERRLVPSSALLRRVAAAVAPNIPVQQIDDGDCTAFTYGVVRPRIVVTSGLVATLSERQLTAVLVHEKAHVDGSDPLRALAAGSFGRVLLHAPALPPLLRCHLRRRELAADRAAVRVVGRAALAEALLVVLAPVRAAGAPVAALGLGDSDSLLRARVLQLETGERMRPEINTWQLLGSLPAVVLFVAIALTCGH